MSKKEYEDTLYRLQIELVKLQRHLIKSNDRIMVVFEGRDAAGKDGTIKRITEHLSPRETRVVALGKPSQPGKCSADELELAYKTCRTRCARGGCMAH